MHALEHNLAKPSAWHLHALLSWREPVRSSQLCWRRAATSAALTRACARARLGKILCLTSVHSPKLEGIYEKLTTLLASCCHFDGAPPRGLSPTVLGRMSRLAYHSLPRGSTQDLARWRVNPSHASCIIISASSSRLHATFAARR